MKQPAVLDFTADGLDVMNSIDEYQKRLDFLKKIWQK